MVSQDLQVLKELIMDKRMLVACKQLQIQQAKIDELEAKIKKLEQYDIFWLVGDPENGCDSAEELVSQFIDADSIGKIFELEVAHRLPNINVKILPDDDHGRTEIEYLHSIKNNK